CAHEPDPERDRQDGGKQEVDDRLVDRHVERSDVDRHPRVELELVLRVVVDPGRSCSGRGGEGDDGEAEQDGEAPHRSSARKKVTSETPSCIVYATPYRSAAISPRWGCETATAIMAT